MTPARPSLSLACATRRTVATLWRDLVRAAPAVAAVYLIAPAAHAACVPDGAEPVDLALPPLQITVAANAPVGAVLDTVKLSPGKDLGFRCSGTANKQEVKIGTPAVVLPGEPNLFATGVPGIGVRVTTRSGNFAGIDDGPRVAPFSINLPPNAATLAGLLIQVDFVKTGTVQSAGVPQGKLVSVTVGGTELASVYVPPGSIMVAAQDCSAVNVGGAVAMGVGTGGAFSQETVAVSTGCAIGLEAVISTGNRYVYGSPPLIVPETPHHTAPIIADTPHGLVVAGSHALHRPGEPWAKPSGSNVHGGDGAGSGTTAASTREAGNATEAGAAGAFGVNAGFAVMRH